MVKSKKSMKTVGIFALQGAVGLHIPHLEALGLKVIEIRRAEDFDLADGFILPGGESTTMLKLIDIFELEPVMRDHFARKPVWGICAGCILIAKKVTHPAQRSFGLIDIAVERNGYGSQVDSHETSIDGYPVSFIRAPIIRTAGPGVKVLALHRGLPAWVRQDNIIASTFHPELTLDFPSPMHRLFASLL
jgi:5'-phosphate synthase pdxT subunit